MPDGNRGARRLENGARRQAFQSQQRQKAEQEASILQVDSFSWRPDQFAYEAQTIVGAMLFDNIGDGEPRFIPELGNIQQGVGRFNPPGEPLATAPTEFRMVETEAVEPVVAALVFPFTIITLAANKTPQFPPLATFPEVIDDLAAAGTPPNPGDPIETVRSALAAYINADAVDIQSINWQSAIFTGQETSRYDYGDAWSPVVDTLPTDGFYRHAYRNQQGRTIATINTPMTGSDLIDFSEKRITFIVSTGPQVNQINVQGDVGATFACRVAGPMQSPDPALNVVFTIRVYVIGRQVETEESFGPFDRNFTESSPHEEFVGSFNQTLDITEEIQVEMDFDLSASPAAGNAPDEFVNQWSVFLEHTITSLIQSDGTIVTQSNPGA